MKKTFFILLSFLFLTPSTFAATLGMDFSIDLQQNESKEIAPVNITSTSAGDVTAQHGIRLILGSDQILWHATSTPVFSGKAVETGKVASTPEYKYSKDYKSLFIPVKQDFAISDNLRISGLKFKTYEDSFNDRFMGMDLNGDLVPDVTDINTYEVTADELNDKVAPYPIADLAHTLNPDGSVKLTWSIPPDYDYATTLINATKVKNGISSPSTLSNNFQAGYTDTNLQDVTSVTYTFIAIDTGGNWSTPVELKLDLTTSPEPQDPQIPEDPQPADPETPPTQEPDMEEEIADLKNRLTYYELRYKIACMPNGIPVNENDPFCLWAKIDLVYAQQITGEVKVSNLSLSERDLYLMSVRRKFPEMRHQTMCVEAAVSADYCISLGKAVKRISYFLD